MKFLQDNPFLSSLGLVAILILGGGGFFVFSEMESAALAREDYEGKVRQLHQLQNAVPYPNAANLAKMEEGTEEMRQALQKLREEIARSQPAPVEDITPQQFQDDLRKAVLRAQAKADEFEVSLGEDFYFGFNRYQTNPPRPEATGELMRQLTVLEELLNRLIETRVASIELRREVLPVEDGKTPEKIPLVVREPLTLRLTGEQGRVRLAINSILDLPQFVVIRALGMTNSQLAGPARETDAAVLAGKSSANDSPVEALFGEASATPGGKPESLPIVLGRESLTATLRLELLDFRGFKIEG
jgi:hypothetical protein